ncbi:MAG: hypothetical protein JWP52_804, partial [Rhizobacter sp.]|nr:hypothetical protein [Rhizobacter sp.]
YKDLAPIAVVTEAPLALVINPAQVPVDNFADYLAWAAKKKPLFIATMGIGTMSHFDAVLLGTEAANPPELVHYRGTGEALTGLHSGDVQGMFASPAFAMAQVRGGGLRALATTSPERLPMLADVPTLRELGRPQLEINAWFGLFAPAGTPLALLDRLSDGAVKAVSAPDAAAQLADSGFRATNVGRAAMASFLQAEDRRWSRIVADAKFHIDV